MAVGDMVVSALGAAQRAQLDRNRQGGARRPMGPVRLGSMANPIKQVPQASPPVAQAVAAPQSAPVQMTTGQEAFAPGGMFGPQGVDMQAYQQRVAQNNSAQGVVPMDTSAMDAWNRANTMAQMGGPANTAEAPVQAMSSAQQFAQPNKGQDFRNQILQAFQQMQGFGGMQGGQMGSLGRPAGNGAPFPTGPAMRPANSGGFGQFNPQMLQMLQNRGNMGNMYANQGQSLGGSIGSGRQWPF